MLKILDSTLREGEQTPGVYFDTHIKVAIAELLDEVGINIIETGHPAVSAEIYAATREIAKRGLNATAGAHARSLKNDVDLAIECGVGFLGIFFCVSDRRLNHHSKSLTQAIDTIVEAIQYAREKSPDLLIRYTPEDTVRSPWENVIAAAAEAVVAGANIISVADTTGYMIPGTDRDMGVYVKKLKDELSRRGLCPEIAVHCHNDRGFALANAIGGYLGGASIIDTSVLGLGERTGIVDLATLLAVLSSDFQAKGVWDLTKMPRLYNLVSRYANISIPVNAPIIGKNSFTHCAGVHTQAALKNPAHYQSVDPVPFGRKPKIALDHMSGLSAVKFSLEQIGEHGMDREMERLVLSKIKAIGQTGRTVDLQELRYIVKYIKEHAVEKIS